MRFWKRILGLLLVLGAFGVVWGVWGVWEKVQSARRIGGLKVAEERKDEEKPIGFAVMGDVHGDWENFRQALEIAKADIGIGDFGGVGLSYAKASTGKGFVIITGDLTTIGKKSELLKAKKILDESGLRYYVIPGNHDVWWGREYKRDVWGEVFGESFGSFRVSEFQSFKDKEIKLILVNNGDGVGGIGGFGGVRESGEKQIDWLKKETEECQKIYCLVFLHMPLNHPSSPHIMGEEKAAVASEAAKLIELLVKNKVKEVFAGHLHFSSSYELNDLKTTIVGAITRERNFQSPKFLAVSAKRNLLGEMMLEKREIFLDDRVQQ